MLSVIIVNVHNPNRQHHVVHAIDTVRPQPVFGIQSVLRVLSACTSRAEDNNILYVMGMADRQPPSGLCSTFKLHLIKVTENN